MAAVLGGFAAAVIWSLGAVGASRAARGIGSSATLAWVMLIGLALVAAMLPFAPGLRLSGGALLWLLVGGLGNVGGLLLWYRALRVGQLGVVMSIVTVEGGIAATMAIAAGQTVTAVEAAALALTVLGVVLTGIVRGPAGEIAQPDEILPVGSLAVGRPTGHGDRRAAGWAILAAFAFGGGLYGTGRAGALVPAVWAVLPPRAVGVAVVALPLLARRRLRAPGQCARWLVLSGVCEVGGFLAYALGARHGLPVAAVLSTLTGALGAGVGRLVFGERLVPAQLLGVAATFVGVAVLTGLSAGGG